MTSRTLSGLNVGDFDELVVDDDFALHGTMKVGGVTTTGGVSCASLTATGGASASYLNVNTNASIGVSGAVIATSLDAGSGTVQTEGALEGGSLFVNGTQRISALGGVSGTLLSGTSLSLGNATIGVSGDISCSSVGVGSGSAASVSSLGVISGAAYTGPNGFGVGLGTGAISTGGSITGASLNAGAGTIETTGEVECGSLSVSSDTTRITAAGAVTCASVGASGAVTCGQIIGTSLLVGGVERISSGGAVIAAGLSCTSADVNGHMTAQSLTMDMASPALTTTYPNTKINCTNLDLTSGTNKILPPNVYYTNGHYKLAINAGMWRPNDDSSYYNIHIEDEAGKGFGRAKPASSSLEMMAFVQIPAHFRATHVYIDATDSSGTALFRTVDAYRVYNFDTTGQVSAGSGTTNNEFAISLASGYMDGAVDTVLMLDVTTTSNTDHVAGGYVKLTYIG